MADVTADFSGTAGDPPPAPWIVEDWNGNGLVVLDGSGSLRMERATSIGQDMAIWRDDGGTFGQLLALVEPTISSTQGGIGLVIRADSTDDLLRPRLDFGTTHNSIRIRERAGSDTVIGSTSWSRPLAPFRMRCEVFDAGGGVTTARMRVWEATDPEPETWDISGPTTLTVPAAPAIGITVYTGAGDGEGHLVHEFSHDDYDDGGTPTTYPLTTEATNGAVTRDPDQASYEEDAEVELTATPDSGYQAAEPLWTGDAIPSGQENANPLTYTMPGAAATVTANFEEEPALDKVQDVDVTVTASTRTTATLDVSWDDVTEADGFRLRTIVTAVNDGEA